MEQDNISPLQHFVVAKRTISAVFDQLLEFVREGSDFVEGKMDLICNYSDEFVVLPFSLF